jgi:hypothetical protein
MSGSYNAGSAAQRQVLVTPDTLADYTGGVNPKGWMAITPSDSTTLTLVGFRVYTTAGNVAVQNSDGTTYTIPACQLYEQIPGRFTKILATGTTAVGISGAYI